MTDFIINTCLKDRFMVLLAAIILAAAGVWSFRLKCFFNKTAKMAYPLESQI